jgi:hypothetical protein
VDWSIPVRCFPTRDRDCVRGFPEPDVLRAGVGVVAGLCGVGAALGQACGCYLGSRVSVWPRRTRYVFGVGGVCAPGFDMHALGPLWS